MLEIRPIESVDRELHNGAVHHPLQTFEWGEFRRSLGEKVLRYGWWDGKLLLRSVQLTLRAATPHLNRGYCLKSFSPDPSLLDLLQNIARRENCVSIKLEPMSGVESEGLIGLRRSKGSFSHHSIELDLRPDEDHLLQSMHAKTRYNIRRGNRQGLKVDISASREAFGDFLHLLQITAERQGFPIASIGYYWKFWDTFHQSNCFTVFRARHQERTVASAVVLQHHNKMYYTHAASSRIFPGLMHSHVLLWEIIRHGKQKGLHTLDFWGTPNPSSGSELNRFFAGFGGSSTTLSGAFEWIPEASI